MVHSANVTSKPDDTPRMKHPENMKDLQYVLTKLRYQFTAKDCWGVLGFSRIDGPDPTSASITARERAAMSLLSMVTDTWANEAGRRRIP